METHTATAVIRGRPLFYGVVMRNKKIIACSLPQSDREMALLQANWLAFDILGVH